MILHHAALETVIKNREKEEGYWRKVGYGECRTAVTSLT
jgi:hypothetical protein